VNDVELTAMSTISKKAFLVTKEKNSRSSLSMLSFSIYSTHSTTEKKPTGSSLSGNRNLILLFYHVLYLSVKGTVSRLTRFLGTALDGLIGLRQYCGAIILPGRGNGDMKPLLPR
jgi:hypothetical protein